MRCALLGSKNSIARRSTGRGNLFPLLWILHVNKVIEETCNELEKEVLSPRKAWRLIIQLFAHDTSAAIPSKDKGAAIALAERLAMILMEVLRELKLEVAQPKCNNFIITGGGRTQGREFTSTESDF